jgi:uncharacterized protein
VYGAESVARPRSWDGDGAHRRARTPAPDVDADGFVENDWIGHTLAVGDGVRLPVTVAEPRWVVITPPGRPPEGPGHLRTAAQHNRVEIPGSGPYPCVGVYATVAAGGRVRRGDRVALD